MTLKKPKKKLNNIQNIIMAGIGGTGVSTVAAIIVMAARIDKIICTINEFYWISSKKWSRNKSN